MGMTSAVPWATAGLLLLSLVLALRRPLGAVLRLVLRSAAGLVFLSVLSKAGGTAGIGLGINWFNALVLGLLGAPGFGLLLLLKWLF